MERLLLRAMRSSDRSEATVRCSPARAAASLRAEAAKMLCVEAVLTRRGDVPGDGCRRDSTNHDHNLMYALGFSYVHRR